MEMTRSSRGRDARATSGAVERGPKEAPSRERSDNGESRGAEARTASPRLCVCVCVVVVAPQGRDGRQ
eukprot:7383509-Prymnesium_polylepis.1